MPWDPASPPSAFSKYSEKCQRAAVHAANSTLEKTKDDGRAMAAGHAAAKQCEGKKSMDAPMFKFELGTADLPLRASLDPQTGKRRIEGISSSTLRDGHGDSMTLRALEKMAKQAIGMNVWLNHEYKVPRDAFGTITRARVQDSGEREPKTGLPIYDLMCGMDVDEDSEDAITTHKMISKGKKLGISVGAMLPENGEGVTKSQDGGRYVFDDLDLVEMSIVGVPANGRCWATVATKSLKEAPDFAAKIITKDVDPSEIDPTSGEDLEKIREGEQTTRQDVEEGTDNDGSSDGIVTGPDIMPDADPDPDAKPVDALVADAEGEDGQKDRESIEEGGNDDGVVTTEDLPGLDVAQPEGETKKTRVTVWDGDKTVQIDTGRSRKTGDDQSAQDDSPESAGGLPSETSKALTPVGASTDQMLIRGLRASLSLAVDRADAAEAERDRAYEHAAHVVEKAEQFIDKIGQLPMGRRATFEEVKSDVSNAFSTDLDRLTFLDPGVKRLLIKRNAEEPDINTGSPK